MVWIRFIIYMNVILSEFINLILSGISASEEDIRRYPRDRMGRMAFSRRILIAALALQCPGIDHILFLAQVPIGLWHSAWGRIIIGEINVTDSTTYKS